jgi:hypothetical protein
MARYLVLMLALASFGVVAPEAAARSKLKVVGDFRPAPAARPAVAPATNDKPILKPRRHGAARRGAGR